GALLDVAHFTQRHDSRRQRHETGHFNCYRHALVERAQDDGLPATARKASDADAHAIDVRMIVEIIQTLAHRQIKHTEAVGSYQIQVSGKPVLIAGLVELAVGEPL